MQHRSPPQSRGAILAAGNFLTFGGMLFTAGLFAVLRFPVGGQPFCSSRQIFFLCGLATVPVFLYIIWLLPQASIRFFVWLSSQVIYRIRVYNEDVIPERGGALLVANHVSWLDGVLIMLVTARPVRMIAFAGNFRNPWLRRLADLFGVILITPRRKSVVTALRTAREALLNGHLVCIFPEGGITRTGHLQSFRPGLLRIIDGTAAPVIPVYLDELWGSIFSFSGGKFFWKRPQQWPYPVSIHFGTPITEADNVHAVRQAIQQLGATAVNQRASRQVGLARNFVHTCKRRKRGVKVADSLGNELTGGDLLTRSLILRRLLKRGVLDEDDRFVGLLLPPSVAAVVANMAISLDRRVSANLNYTASPEVLNACLAQAGIRRVLTSRSFMDKVRLELDAELVYLEDFRTKARWRDKLSAALAAYLVPAGILARSLGLHRVEGDDLVTVIFTSGSTGVPKGVMLTETNVGSNVEAIQQVVHLQRDDVLVGILPFFHSFGYTVTMWSVMGIDVKGVYHFNPLDGRQVGKLCKKQGGTVLLATPTFLRTYLRRCEKEDFESLDTIIVGAERLPSELSDAFEERFGVRPVEGYGTTELSPLVAANIPPSRSLADDQVDAKEGTVGCPIPGVSAKVTDLETGEEAPVGQAGMLWIKGPNVMKGYLGREDLTRRSNQRGHSRRLVSYRRHRDH
jgi:acyl-[acyl-carrier-protein]-phospholipid O-acyltransferase/long-chain-fatty-acid--[acyl-carrier-protein] ligase